MFKKILPGRPSRDKANPSLAQTSNRETQEREGPPPRLELPRRSQASSLPGALKSGAPRPPHLKPVMADKGPGREAVPGALRSPAQPVARPGVYSPETRPQAARPAIPPYPVSGARTPAAAARGAEVQSFGRLMLVGPLIRLKGEIKACERLVIEGAVEGEVSDTACLEVVCGGRFQGKAQVESCSIDGEFEGELHVLGVLSLKSHGRVTGKVRYGEIEIERGGTIAGDFMAQAGPATARTAQTKIPRPA